MTVALLAPIGIMHLRSAVDVGMTTVSFGTRALDTLKQFEDQGGSGAPVLFYASYDDGARDPHVTWTGEFVDVEPPSATVRHPDE